MGDIELEFIPIHEDAEKGGDRVIHRGHVEVVFSQEPQGGIGRPVVHAPESGKDDKKEEETPVARNDGDALENIAECFDLARFFRFLVEEEIVEEHESHIDGGVEEDGGVVLLIHVVGGDEGGEKGTHIDGPVVDTETQGAVGLIGGPCNCAGDDRLEAAAACAEDDDEDEENSVVGGHSKTNVTYGHEDKGQAEDLFVPELLGKGAAEER